MKTENFTPVNTNLAVSKLPSMSANKNYHLVDLLVLPKGDQPCLFRKMLNLVFRLTFKCGSAII